MTTETITPVTPRPTVDTVRIDFLFLDLTTCTRCRGTDHSLGAALATVADALQAAGVQVEVNKVHVATEDLARAWRFVSSPTIRVDGTDIALELRESSCGSEACTDGCGDQIACRVWVHHGEEYTEPPAEMIVDAILRHVYGTTPEPSPAQSYELPTNLRRFFAGKPASARPEQSIQDNELSEAVDTGCCPPAEREICCDSSTKADCCADATEPGCGCR